MDARVGQFAKGYAWWMVKDGLILDQGWEPGLLAAQSELRSAIRLWNKAVQEEQEQQ